MIKVTDDNNTDLLLKELQKLRESTIEIGILSGSDSKLLMIAAVNEFGVDIQVTKKMRGFLARQGLFVGQTITIPERSYIRGGYDSNRKRIEALMDQMYLDVANFKKTADEALDNLGEVVSGMIKEFMTDLRTPPNHPFTIQKKESSNPLIATGGLRDKITYRIVRR